MADDDRRKRQQQPPNALTASAVVLDPTKIRRLPQPKEWQAEAWHYLFTVPETSFAIGWLQNAMTRCRILAANRGDGGDEPAIIQEPEEVTAGEEPPPNLSPADQAAFDLVTGFAGGTTGQSQILGLSTVHLAVPGDGYLLGVPTTSAAAPDQEANQSWGVYSADEVTVENGRYYIREGEQATDRREMPPETLAVRMWRKNPRYQYLAHSPMRATLPVLRELELLTQHVEASGVSRLAGAGILILPEEITFPIKPENVAENKTTFIEVLGEAMVTPITDRNDPSAVVPLVVQVKGEYIKDIQHLTFATPLDEKALGLREEAIKRFAAGMDIPAEVVLGLASSNHWTAWQIEESAIKLHIEPMLEAICDGLTVGYLRPALVALGFADVADDYVVWYDASELNVRPDRSGDVAAAYTAGVVGARTYRREIGMGDEDAPTEEETLQATILKVIDKMPASLPILLPLLGIDVDVPTDIDPLPVIRETGPIPAPGDETGAPPAPGTGPPSKGPTPPDNGPSNAASIDEAALLASADGLVYRALERAGNRLANAARAAGCAAMASGALTHTGVPEEVRTGAIDACLEGAWDRVPEIAARFDIDPHALAATLDGYARSLILAGWPHEIDRLAEHLGA